MTATVRTILEFDDGTTKWVHTIPPKSSALHLNIGQADYVAKIAGPSHDPYWLLKSGKVVKKGP